MRMLVLSVTRVLKLRMGDSRMCVHGAQEGGFRAASEAAAAEIGVCCPLQWKNYLTVTAALSADIMD